MLHADPFGLLKILILIIQSHSVDSIGSQVVLILVPLPHLGVDTIKDQILQSIMLVVRGIGLKILSIKLRLDVLADDSVVLIRQIMQIAVYVGGSFAFQKNDGYLIAQLRECIKGNG